MSSPCFHRATLATGGETIASVHRSVYRSNNSRETAYTSDPIADPTLYISRFVSIVLFGRGWSVVRVSPRTMVHLSSGYYTRPPPTPSTSRRVASRPRGRARARAHRFLAGRTESRAFANYVRVGSFRRYRSRSRRTGDRDISTLAVSRAAK